MEMKRNATKMHLYFDETSCYFSFDDAKYFPRWMQIFFKPWEKEKKISISQFRDFIFIWFVQYYAYYWVWHTRPFWIPLCGEMSSLT